MDYKDKKVEEILEELKNVLDSITKSGSKTLQEEGFKKIENIKNVLKSEDIEVKAEEQIFSKDKLDLTESLLSKGEKQKDEKENIIKEKTSSDDKTKEDEKTILQDRKDEKLLIKTMLVFPSILQDAKNEFLDNINSTLKRVSKKNIEVISEACIGYNSLGKDVFLQYNLIIEKIKIYNLSVFILIVNENTPEVEEFIKKISSFVLLAKSISTKELKMKSTYLDLSIDLLLTIK